MDLKAADSFDHGLTMGRRQDLAVIIEEHGVCMIAFFIAFRTRKSYLERKISYSISAPHYHFEINTIAAGSTKYHNRHTSFKALKLHAICP